MNYVIFKGEITLGFDAENTFVIFSATRNRKSSDIHRRQTVELQLAVSSFYFQLAAIDEFAGYDQSRNRGFQFADHSPF